MYDKADKVCIKARIKRIYTKDAIRFINFLKVTGKGLRNSPKISFSLSDKCHLTIFISNPVAAESLIQNLILNKGLYYYCCGIENSEDVINNVLLPFLTKFISVRFSDYNAKFLEKHLLGKLSQTSFIPVNIKNTFGKRFEILFKKWDLKIINNQEYVVELDALLNNFLLKSSGYKMGERSSEFGILLKTAVIPFDFDRDFRKSFLKIHSLRTGTVHRLQNIKPEDNLDYHSGAIYNFFLLLDEYAESQNTKIFTIRGKKYNRIKYGYEPHPDDFNMEEFASNNPCHDCFVRKGSYHIFGCDVESCPRCRHQLISCDCKWDFYKN